MQAASRVAQRHEATGLVRHDVVVVLWIDPPRDLASGIVLEARHRAGHFVPDRLESARGVVRIRRAVSELVDLLGDSPCAVASRASELTFDAAKGRAFERAR